jgi:hypothetical protein
MRVLFCDVVRAHDENCCRVRWIAAICVPDNYADFIAVGVCAIGNKIVCDVDRELLAANLNRKRWDSSIVEDKIRIRVRIVRSRRHKLGIVCSSQGRPE